MRKKRNYTRDHKPDLKYGSTTLTRFINTIMEDGKKAVAEKIIYDAFEVIKKESGKDPLEVFNQALENAMPVIEVSSKRVGGANYQVPREVRPARRFMLGTRWIIGAARKKSGSPMSIRLAEEILAASKNEGVAIKKKDEVRRMAEANRAFAHFSW